MGLASTAPMPLQDIVVDKRRLMTREWADWFTLSLLLQVQQAPRAFKVVSLRDQTASIGTTAIPIGADSAAGLYRVSVTARVTTPASVSSSLTVTIGYTCSSVACQFTTPALTGNAITSVLSSVVLVKNDANAPLVYSTTYASTAAGMAYQLDIVAESIG